MLPTARAFPLWSRCKRAIKQNWSSRSSSHRFQGRLYTWESCVQSIFTSLPVRHQNSQGFPGGYCAMAGGGRRVMCKVWSCVGKVPHLPRASPVSLNCPRTSESVAEPGVRSSSNNSTNQSPLFILSQCCTILYQIPSQQYIFNQSPKSNNDDLKGKRVVDI